MNFMILRGRHCGAGPSTEHRCTMTENYDLYRISAPSLDEAKAVAERALGVLFVEHESEYHGGVYYRHGHDGQEHFILKRNFDDVDGEFFEPEYEDTEFLLYANQTRRPEAIRKLIVENSAGIRLRAEALN